jgi:PTS system N-acetylglucosamine-specific IIC component
MTLQKFAALQQLGRTLMLPIAVLPIAGLLLRLGQPDLLDIAFMAQAGDAIFANLPLLFAVGVAVGFAKDNHGVAGLAGAVGYFVMISAMKTIDPKINMGVLAGLIIGAVAGLLYNRYRNIRLPEWLAFFGGKRFVPIATGLAALVLAAVFGVAWPPIQQGIDLLGHWLIGSGETGLFIYGALNRLLLVTGLHHILNNLVWFVFGDFTAANEVIHGDLKRFYAGDATAGAFMTGFFPVMMFGLPAACLAMYRNARPENRHLVGGVLLSMALTSFFTGVTEPIEFAFLFLAPVLFGIHALLTGVSMALMHALGVKAGFTFSGGAFDYVLSYGISTQSWIIVPVGLGYAALYYGLFSYFIRRFDLATLGREAPPLQPQAGEAGPPAAAGEPAAVPVGAEPAAVPAGVPAVAVPATRAAGFVAALGGAANLLDVDACTTRLRLAVKDNALVRESDLKALGARGLIRPAPGSVQVVLGPIADSVADEIRLALKGAA